jgi:nucleotide-binding universal stress UspA family protein
MSYRRIHLPLFVHGSATSQGTIKYACGLARAFDASLRVTSPRLIVRTPASPISGKVLARLAHELEQAAAAKSAELVDCVRQEAAIAGLAVAIETVDEPWPVDWSAAALRGRTSDLNVIGLPREGFEERRNVEAWVFGTGRPCLIHPNDRSAPFSLDSVVIAWDLSRAAARAVGDALPLLKRAKTVHIFEVRGEKEIPSVDPGASVTDYLAAHGIQALTHEGALEGRRIGGAILEGAAELRADLVVMGAFGHSRLREFVLGGATRDALDHTSVPLLMAH